MAFHDVIFPEQVSQGASGGPVFSTTVVTSSSGFEQRNVNWQYPLHRYDVSHVLHSSARRKELKQFFMLRQGRAHTFRFLDHQDYYIGMDWTGAHPNVLEHDAAHDFATGDGSETAFQLGILYGDAAAELFRKITKPISAIKVYLDQVEQVAGYSVDYDTGVLTFDVAPGVGVDVGWSGMFHVHARFESDEAIMALETPHTGEWGRILIQEVRE